MSPYRRASIPAAAWERHASRISFRRRDWWAVGLAWLLVPGIALIVSGVRSIQLVPPLERVAAPVAPASTSDAVVVSSLDIERAPAPAKQRRVAKVRRKAPAATLVAPSPPVTIVVTTPAEPKAEPPVAEAVSDGRPAVHADAYTDRDVVRTSTGEREESTHADRSENEGRHAAETAPAEAPAGRS
jgi:hypothetical protein